MIDVPALAPGNVAVITGGASGIGLAAACKFAAMGLRVCVADCDEKSLASATKTIAVAASRPSDVSAFPCDVSRMDELVELERAVRAAHRRIDVLMNNAGIQPGSQMFGPPKNWEQTIAVNLWGVIHGARVFAPAMISQKTPGLIINTGSKQGITTPPGDPAYNISKAGVKVFTEALEHELRSTPGCRISARLLIPGFVFTGLTARSQPEKPPGAWTPEQTVDYMIERLAAGDFYILCPDNEVSRELDEKRIAWAAGDIIENRPPLSRWHPDYVDCFKEFLKKN